VEGSGTLAIDPEVMSLSSMPLKQFAFAQTPSNPWIWNDPPASVRTAETVPSDSTGVSVKLPRAIFGTKANPQQP
jgi:hypothetical protein